MIAEGEGAFNAWESEKVRKVEDCGIGCGGASRGCGEGVLCNGQKLGSYL